MGLCMPHGDVASWVLGLGTAVSQVLLRYTVRYAGLHCSDCASYGSMERAPVGSGLGTIGGMCASDWAMGEWLMTSWVRTVAGGHMVWHRSVGEKDRDAGVDGQGKDWIGNWDGWHCHCLLAGP